MGIINYVKTVWRNAQDGPPNTALDEVNLNNIEDAISALDNLAVANTDSRLTDTRTPSGAAGGDLSGTYPNPTVVWGHAPTDGAAGVASLRTLGTAGTQAAAGNDSRITSAATAANLTAETTARQNADALLQPKSEKGQVSGYAALDATGLVPTTQLPPYPTVPVSSVAGKTGNVTLAEADIQGLVADLAARALANDLVNETTARTSADALRLLISDTRVAPVPTASGKWLHDKSGGLAWDVIAIADLPANIPASQISGTAAVTADVTAEASARASADALRLLASANLSDVASAATSRTNLGLGSAATQASSAFAPATGIAESAVTGLVSDLAARLIAANNLSDISVPATARTNLGLGSAATHPSTDFAPSSGIAESAVTGLTTDLAARLIAANNLSDLTDKAAARTNLGVDQIIAAWVSIPTGTGSTVTIGTLPANAFILNVAIFVDSTSLFNGTGDNTINVGFLSGSATALTNKADASTAGLKNPQYGTSVGYNSTSQTVQAYYNGTSPTTGKALVVVEYYIVPVRP